MSDHRIVVEALGIYKKRQGVFGVLEAYVLETRVDDGNNVDFLGGYEAGPCMAQLSVLYWKTALG
jgi:hypothetical protein